jgi:GNAT superfamily N-acetyltransferase
MSPDPTSGLPEQPVRTYRLRNATVDDRPDLEALIALSARNLGTRYYTPDQIEGALRGAFGVDTQLILDGTYFVAEDAGQIVGCGGWSRRRTLFGSDQAGTRDSGLLDPRREAARIRAFFVSPAHARRGIATAILKRCEAAAQAEGFTRLELMATLSGVPLYAALGYEAAHSVRYQLGSELTIDFVPMSKSFGSNQV